MKCLIAAVALGTGLLLAVGTARGQHHDAHLPIHHGLNFGHNNWQYVVPHHSAYSGGYYTADGAHYYTPSHISPRVSDHGHHAAPPPHIEVQRPVALTFGGYRRYEDLAGRLSAAANDLCLEMHYNYRHNENFAAVYREAYGVLQAAKYVHGREHAGDREAIRERIAEVDGLFHHVQDEVSGWSRDAARRIGAGALPEKIAGVEAVLHHLCYDVGVKPHEQATEAAPPPSEAPPPPPSR